MKRSHRSTAVAVALLGATLALAACSSGGSSGGPTTVSGTVIDASGAPVSGANVLLDGAVASLVTTGADGKFSFASVTPPYSLTVKSGTAITEIHGLTRTTVTVADVFGGGAVHVSKLSGTLTGPTYPLPSGEGILLGATHGVLTGSFADSSGVFTNASFYWSGAATNTTDIAALHVAATGGVITSYGPVGKKAGVTLQDGVDQSGIDFSLGTAVTSTSTTLSYSPGAYSSSGRIGYMQLRAGGATFLLTSGSLSVPTGTSLAMPDGGGSFMISGQDASGNQAARIVTAVLGGTTTLDLPAATALANSLPANAATGVSKTPTLSWTPVSGANLYVVHLSSGSLDYYFLLPSGSSSLAVPDYTALGLPLAGGSLFNWSVLALQASSLDVDGLTDPSGGGSLSEITLYSVGDLAYYQSAETSFTTAP